MGEKGLAILLFGAAAIFCIGYAIYQYVRLILNKDKIKYIDATVIETSTAVAETMKVTNSRWASVGFWVDGKQHISSERILVPMHTSVGDEVKVVYLKDNPSIIFTPSWKKATIFLGIGILCLVIMVYFQIRS